MDATPVPLLSRPRPLDSRSAWGRFVRLYCPVLFHWVKKAGLQGPDAEDMVQEIFLVLVKKLPEFDFDQHKSFRGWLAVIVRDKFIERRRNEAAGLARADNLLLTTL